MKKIVIAIDSFKGCLSSAEAGEAGGMGGGLLASHPERLSLGVFFVYRVLHLLLREFDVSDMVPTLSCWDIDYNRIKK